MTAPPLEVQGLVRRSVEVIREGQAPSGAYVACPTFAPYRFCWLRDGAFIAEAMSRVGETGSADAFHAWVARVVLARGDRDRLDARYTLEGEDDPVEEWPHLQHDGWGLWLWTLRGRTPPPEVAQAAEHVAAYLERVWREPCVDWWEERSGLHAATLACVDAGLRAWGRDGVDRSLADDRLDASLLVLPFLGYEAEDEVRSVEEALVGPGGGVHRHLEDDYYGGGEWLLLTALLGLARPERAEDALRWIAGKATEDGLLPEQSQDHLLAPDAYEPWLAKWGPPPCPLLWSHAMYLTLAHATVEPALLRD